MALASLPGAEWSKDRGFHQAPGTWTFLDRLQRLLREAEPRDEMRGELVRLWCLRSRMPAGGDAGSIDAKAHVACQVQELVCQKLDGTWHEPYQRLRRVLRGAVRASIAVECVNSVLRMQQSRHRTVTQEMLDLRRL